jgi:pimeloyl-ACP methyl ester carboxylesterase
MASLSSESFAATRSTEESAKIGGTHVSTESKKRQAVEAGTFLGEFLYVRVGNGPENLVILPGITLENDPPNRLAAWTYRLGFGRFARDYTVYVINRKRGMPPAGYTTQDMAQDYTRVIESELGPSHIMGFSTGGAIAQYLALERPEVVRSLILIVSASRLSEEGREICERWQALTREERWQELRKDMASVTVTGERNKRLARAFMKVLGRFVIGTPENPSDFLVTLEADLNHDTTERLNGIYAPTLIIGGSEDPFFSESLLRETAEKIPDATLHIYEGVGHGVPKERKRRYENDTLAFLDDEVDRTVSSRAKEMR